jgi:hypothetical protein
MAKPSWHPAEPGSNIRAENISTLAPFTTVPTDPGESNCTTCGSTIHPRVAEGRAVAEQGAHPYLELVGTTLGERYQILSLRGARSKSGISAVTRRMPPARARQGPGKSHPAASSCW